MSNSAAGAAGVDYQVSVDAGSDYNLQTIILDFCSNSPFPGDSCTAPSGFTLGSSPTVDDITLNGTADTGTWTASSLNSGRTLQLTRASPVSMGSGEPVSFELAGVTNPAAVGTFYARLFAYSNSSPGYTDTLPGNYSDNGGFALSTTNTISITARVMPYLQFCASGAVPTAECGNVTTPDIDIGHGTIKAIDDSAVDTASVYSQLSTNAQHGAVIQAKFFPNGSCYGLADGNGDCINPVGSGTSATPVAMTAGAAAFGLMVENGSAISGGTGSTAATTVYHDSSDTSCAGTVDFNFRASSGTNMASTYGDEVASSTGAVSDVNNTYCFGATANATTPSGVYTADLSLIATGTF